MHSLFLFDQSDFLLPLSVYAGACALLHKSKRLSFCAEAFCTKSEKVNEMIFHEFVHPTYTCIEKGRLVSFLALWQNNHYINLFQCCAASTVNNSHLEYGDKMILPSRKIQI